VYPGVGGALLLPLLLAVRVCSVCKGEGRACAYYFTSYACTLGFSEVVHCLVPQPASSVIPMLAHTRGPGALKPGSSGLSQI